MKTAMQMRTHAARSRVAAATRWGWVLASVLAAAVAVDLSAAESPARATSDVARAVTAGTRGGELIVKRTTQLQDELAQLVDEKEFNRLERPAADPLVATIDELGEARGRSVTGAAAALKTAGALTEDEAARDALVAAYRLQRQTALHLREIGAQASVAEAQARLPRQVETLLARQATNLRGTSALVLRTESVVGLVGAPRRRHAVVAMEQDAIERELRLLAATMIQGPAEAPTAGPSKVALRLYTTMEQTALLSLARRATETTASGPLGDAASKQRFVRAALLKLLDAALAEQPILGRLVDARDLADKLKADEQALKEAAASGVVDAATLAERQARINDQTEVLRRMLEGMDVRFVQLVEGSRAGMDAALLALGAGEDPGAGLGEAAEGLDGLGQGLQGAIEGLLGQGGQGDEGQDGSGFGGGEAASRATPPPNVPAPPAQVVGALGTKEREAIAQAQAEKSSPEYAAQVEQYLKNLADAEKGP